MAKRTINVNGQKVRVLPMGTEDYFCLSDIAKSGKGRAADFIKNYLRNKNTIEFLTMWEEIHNPTFNVVGSDHIKSQTGLNNFSLSASEWINETVAKGIVVEIGRYGGTYAHRDITIHFTTWFSTSFYLHFVQELQRLKLAEAKRLGTTWDLGRELTKANHSIYLESVKNNLIPQNLPKNQTGVFYASEADILNVAVFGQTAKEWKIANPKKNGNMRDSAALVDLLIMSNLQVIDAKLIEWGCDQIQRFEILSETATEQRRILTKSQAMKRLKKE